MTNPKRDEILKMIDNWLYGIEKRKDLADRILEWHEREVAKEIINAVNNSMVGD